MDALPKRLLNSCKIELPFSLFQFSVSEVLWWYKEMFLQITQHHIFNDKIVTSVRQNEDVHNKWTYLHAAHAIKLLRKT
jgi:hypothetical protein